MSEIDPDTLLEWLTMGHGDERDMQLIALEQLCMLLLMSDNVDRCFESCPPRSFLPALCHIFMDDTAPDNILEVTARAITYYLDVSAECSRRIISVEGAVKALCSRLMVVDISSRTSKDLAEQCVKVLELMCTREAGAIYDAGGLTCTLSFIKDYGFKIHKDTLHSAMSVVARLCAKMEPNDPTLEQCVDSLSVLLQAEDSYVADSALRCFACLADRFTRRGVDPAPLAKHGLSNVLLNKLASSALQYSIDKQSGVQATSPDTRSNAGNVSIVVSVLSTLCRGSPSVTHDLLRADLLDAIEKAMQGDERCVLDTMRLIDLLLVLLFEGRGALPKSNGFSGRATLTGLKRMDSSAERSHRHLIDCIRSKDTDALIEAIESGTFEVNYMDDVGQTLLNWASAFGTLEMVEFLCERGADVNRGQRSSSLHYAACFGRPAVAKVLLRYGANPDLRDEDSKTPLDKARERNDEGHKEVARILQTPGEWMIPASNTPGRDATTSQTNEEESKPDEEPKEETEDTTVKGDVEMAPLYATRLLPVFAQTFRSSLVPSIRKATLAIMKKVIHYIPQGMMSEVISSCNIAASIVEVLSSVLNVEDDDEGHLTAFHCVEDLMSKGKEIFLVQFVRLGVLNRIKDINDSYEKDDIDKPEQSTGAAEIMPLEDAQSIVHGRPYHWHDWCIVRSRDCLYLWSDVCAVELSNGSNGWFRFVLDGKLATMYSSGSPEGGSGSAESRSEFLEKLQRARAQVPAGTGSQPLLSSQSSNRIIVGNWSLACNQQGQMTIHNADGQQATILKEDLPGFIFESNRGTKHTFTAETSLGPDFAATWSGKPGRKYQSKKEQLRQKVGLFAHEMYSKYFKEAALGSYGAMGKLRAISSSLDNACKNVRFITPENEEQIYAGLKELRDLLKEESMLSSYEIQSSGLVTSLFNCLNKAPRSSLSSAQEKSSQDVSEIFKSVFGEIPQHVHGDESMHQSSLAVALVRKLIAVLESTERLPVITYEHGGSGSGLQVLLRRLRLRLERDSRSGDLIDQSGRYLKMEPLTTVKDLKKHLLKVVAKQWYDYDRGTFKFSQHFKEEKGSITFTYQHDFDENGIVYWVGTNAKTVSEWVNPAQYGLAVVVSSEGRSLPYGKPEDMLSRDSAALNCHTNDDKNSWFMVDFALWITPTAYTLRHARGYGRSALRNWTFQGSKDGQTWTTLHTHENDASLNEPGSTATWMLEKPSPSDENQSWRMFRIQQTGPNASGQTHYLSLSGFEIYGSVTGVTDDAPGSLISETDENNRKRRIFRSHALRQMALGGKEGVDLKLLKERARQLGEAVEAVTSDEKSEDWVDVPWVQSTSASSQRSSNQESTTVTVVDISNPDVRAAMDSREDSKDSKDSKSSTFGLRSSRGIRENIVRRMRHNARDPSELENQSNLLRDPGRELSADLANLRLLMAVEDLLDNASSDLVASALAEAASLDQLRAASRNLQTSFRQSASAEKKSNTAQGSRESSSPPLGVAETEAKVNVHHEWQSETDQKSSSSSSESTSQIGDKTGEKLEKELLAGEHPSSTISLSRDSKVVRSEVSVYVDSKSSSNFDGITEAQHSDLHDKETSDLSTVSEETQKDKEKRVPETETCNENLESVDAQTGDSAEELVHLTSDRESEDTSKRVETEVGGSDEEWKVLMEHAKSQSSNDSSQADTEDKSGFVTEFFDAKSDELTESDKNRQNERGRGLLPSEKDLLFTKNTEVEIEVPERIDSLEKTPEGMTLLEAIEAKLVYDSSDEDENDGDDDEVEDLAIQKDELKICNKSERQTKPSKKIVRDLLLSSGEKTKTEKEGSISATATDSESKKTDSSDVKDGIKQGNSSLQPCSLMVDMEEDYMEDYQMEEAEDTDEFEDIENEDENDPDDLFERTLEVNQSGSSTDKPAEIRRRQWDDDFVLKRQFSALIPAFDPRPGRTNVSQHQDVEIPDESEVVVKESENFDDLELVIRGTIAGSKEIEIPLSNQDASIFSYIQKLATSISSSSSKFDKQIRLWEPTYTIVYRSRESKLANQDPALYKWEVSYVDKFLGTSQLPKHDVVKYLQQNADTEFIKKWKLTGTAKSCKKQRNCNQLRHAYKDFCRIKEMQEKESDEVKKVEDEEKEDEDVFTPVPSEIAQAIEVLDLVKSLHKLCEENNQITSLSDEYLFDVPEEEFISMKLTNKLVQQVQEPLVLASGSLPAWCEFLFINYPLLFPFETRKMYFQATAFGCSRSIVWLQNMHDANLERNRGHPARRLEPQEMRIGRLKHERVKVPREETELLQYAIRLLDFHAGRKAILEIEFRDEEGTGLGPSLEFYALVAKELQKKELGIWVASDALNNGTSETLFSGQKADLYAHHQNGLFPAPYPQDHPNIDRVCKHFHFLGTFLAKCLQDNRLVDIPLSEPFHKLLCLGKPQSTRLLSRGISARSSSIESESMSPRSLESSDATSDCYYCCVDLFSDSDFGMIFPEIFEFIKQLRKLIKKRNQVMNDENLSPDEKRESLENLMFESEHGHECKLEDLGLTFQYIPPSKFYGFDSVNLKPNGQNEILTEANAEEYIDYMIYFCMYKGIEKQLESFREGFSRVFPMEKLHAFSPREIQLMLSGEQAPEWSYDDLINYTEPKFGYTKESPGFIRLINVLVNMNGEERKAFLQFATGCSSLPPGGIANLHPHLTVVKKESEGDGSYPSVNTCVHYLKLPEYSSEEILREKLLAATKEKGFHLN